MLKVQRRLKALSNVNGGGGREGGKHESGSMIESNERQREKETTKNITCNCTSRTRDLSSRNKERHFARVLPYLFASMHFVHATLKMERRKREGERENARMREIGRGVEGLEEGLNIASTSATRRVYDNAIYRSDTARS